MTTVFAGTCAFGLAACGGSDEMTDEDVVELYRAICNTYAYDGSFTAEKGKKSGEKIYTFACEIEATDT